MYGNYQNQVANQSQLAPDGDNSILSKNTPMTKSEIHLAQINTHEELIKQQIRDEQNRVRQEQRRMAPPVAQ